MGLPSTVEAVVIIALIFVPGVIFGHLVRRAIVNFPDVVDIRHVLSMGATGIVLHAVVFPFWTRSILEWYRQDRLDDHWIAIYVWFIGVNLLWPIVAGKGVNWLVNNPWVDRRLLDPVGLSFIDRTPSAWDFVFRDKRDKWVTVHFRDERPPVAGYFGPGSFATVYTTRSDLFLERVHLIDADGNIDVERIHSAGVWISRDVVSHIEFQIGETDEPADTAGPAAPGDGIDQRGS